jgi:hypothetical protein
MSEFSRSRSLLKIAAAFNGVVGVLLGIPILPYILSPIRRDYDRWIPLGTLDQFPTGETRLATFRNPVSNRSDGDTAELPCWCATSMGASSRFSRSIALTSAVPCGGFRSPTYLCVRVTAVRITKKARARRDRLSEDCSNIRSRLSMGNFTSRRESCPH